MNAQPEDNGAHKTTLEMRPLDIERGERLLFRLTEFGRILWETGINVGPGQMLDLAETLSYVDLTSKEEFYDALKCCLLTKHEQEPIFNQMFEYYLNNKRRAQDDDQRNDDMGKPQGTAYTAIEYLRKKDFENFTWEEVQEAKRLMAEMRWHLGMRPTRRKAPAKKGSYPDMRRIVRRNLKYGAELIELTWRKTKAKPRPLVIICDISGSMSLYSRLLLHFVHTISNGLMNVEAFVFGTRLTRITRQLKRRDVDDAVRDVSKSVQDWSGGTRIGDALHFFNHHWAKRVLGRGAVVLIISDGWDRGESDVLGVEMDRLQHSCHRLIWLNPLLGSPDYRPLTIGMKTALPFIDNFLPVHNLDSLISLGNLLSSIDDSRPERSPAARRKAVEAWSKRKP